MTEYEIGTKDKRGLRKHTAPVGDLSTIAFFQAVVLLRRHGPVPGILAARRSRAIMDKSQRRFVTKSLKTKNRPTHKNL